MRKSAAVCVKIFNTSAVVTIRERAGVSSNFRYLAIRFSLEIRLRAGVAAPVEAVDRQPFCRIHVCELADAPLFADGRYPLPRCAVPRCDALTSDCSQYEVPRRVHVIAVRGQKPLFCELTDQVRALKAGLPEDRAKAGHERTATVGLPRSEFDCEFN